MASWRRLAGVLSVLVIAERAPSYCSSTSFFASMRISSLP